MVQLHGKTWSFSIVPKMIQCLPPQLNLQAQNVCAHIRLKW